MIKNYVDIDTKLDKVNDECGVFGIYRNDDDIDVVAAANDALFSLQHRGQQSAGITVNKDGEFTTVKELGMVSEIFRVFFHNIQHVFFVVHDQQFA